MISPSTLHYHTLHRDGKWIGKLDRDAKFRVNIVGTVSFREEDFSCRIQNGTLVVGARSEWDFATGAVDSEDMRIASLLHDSFCRLHETKKISFEARRRGDYLFRKVLEERGCSWFRRWYAYLAVSLYSYMRG